MPGNGRHGDQYKLKNPKMLHHEYPQLSGGGALTEAPFRHLHTINVRRKCQSSKPIPRNDVAWSGPGTNLPRGGQQLFPNTPPRRGSQKIHMEFLPQARRLMASRTRAGEETVEIEDWNTHARGSYLSSGCSLVHG